MKKILLSLLVAYATIIGANAQSFEWGTATWNIEDGRVYEGIDEFNVEGVVLSYPNPSNFALMPLNVFVVDYELYIDDATEPITESSSAQMSTIVKIDYNFAEGHKYKIVTKGASLAQVNLATFSTDTLSVNDASYSISFSVNGPELVKTIEVENIMSLAITDQNWTPTYSIIDTKEICSLLGAEKIEDVAVYGLNGNGSYCPQHMSYFDGWRDADGEYTLWGGGYNSIAGHNAYPAVYSMQLNETADKITYYFYDYWKEYNPEDEGTTGGSSIVTSKRRYAPNTKYSNIIWDWENEDGSVTKYNRSYRCEEGKDYKASFAYVANKKMVIVNATMHFISQEEYNKYLESKNALSYDGNVAIAVAMAQDPGTAVANGAEAQTITLKPGEEEGQVNITFSGFTFPMPPLPTGEMTIAATVSQNTDGSFSFSASNVPVSISNGMMNLIYYADLTGSQASAEVAPVLVLKLRQATVTTAVFASTAEAAAETLTTAMQEATSVDSLKIETVAKEVYSISGARQNAISRGINVVKMSDGSVKKVMK